MSLVIRGSEFTPAPEGVHNAVCVDVVDLGMVEGIFGTKHTIKLVWEIEEKMQDGRRFTVQKRYTASLNEKSNLAKDLKSWRGRAFTSEELKGFDIEKVVGVPCQLVIVHNEKEGQVYANVQTVIKAGATRLGPSGNYTRAKDRPPEQRPTNGRPVNRVADHMDEPDGDPYHDPAQAGGEEIPF